jgi:CO/xanthine dehydrogenase Mo-binding subunit
MTGSSDPVVGGKVLRIDAVKKVRGEASYVVDVPWADAWHGAVARAERAHALVTGIDREAALAMPGVRAVVTADDLDGLFPFFGHYRPDHPILALGRVRYWGEPVAVVVAETLQQAVDAVPEVEVS